MSESRSGNTSCDVRVAPLFPSSDSKLFKLLRRDVLPTFNRLPARRSVRGLCRKLRSDQPELLHPILCSGDVDEVRTLPTSRELGNLLGNHPSQSLRSSPLRAVASHKGCRAGGASRRSRRAFEVELRPRRVARCYKPVA